MTFNLSHDIYLLLQCLSGDIPESLIYLFNILYQCPPRYAISVQ